MMRRLVGNRKEEFERIRRHHEAFAANSWNFKGLDPELRVCMLLNRFSRGLLVMYASPAAEIAIHMSPEQIIGKPILLFIRADDLGSFVEQMDMVKSSSAIMHMRFWFQSPNWPREIPCEAMLFGAVDGMVMGLRRCKPFVRKLLVSGTDQYEARGGIAGSSCSSNCSNPLSAAPYSSTSISPSAHPSGAKSLSPARDLPMTRLSRIGILDLEDFENTKMRPLTEVVVDDPNLVKSTSTLQGYGLWEYRTAECEIEEEDDSGSFGDDFDTEFAARQEDEDDVKADIH
ncbi:hypothetical protein BGZ54_003604 [Gamsiella multidivaricata]|nr:hypothetical protein BGZ54_003604 [Gamsiella multidivaricata]